MSNTYRFSIGPWNISEGRDSYGPEVRPPKDLAWKLALFKKSGFDAVMFHDDDIVPDIDSKTPAQVLKEAADVRRRMDEEGLSVEMVAPRLWFSPSTIDGGFTSNDARDRQYALDRSLRAIDLGRYHGYRSARPVAGP